MHSTNKILFILFFLCNSSAANSQTNLIIYSTVTPNGIPAEFYRSSINDIQPIPSFSIPGYAIVQENKNIDFKAGANIVRLSDIPTFIDPTTVTFKSLTDPETSIIDQEYQFNLINNQRLLEKYLGENIIVEQIIGDKIQTFSGKLLNASNEIIVLEDSNSQILSINHYTNIRFPNLPEGLMNKPTLVWNVLASKTGKHQITTSYQTTHITWWADYNAIYEEAKANGGFLSLSAWVNIINYSGIDYKDTTLKLIAGDINRKTAFKSGPNTMMATDAFALSKNEGFSEKSIFESHLYTLGRKVTIPNNATKQIELFPIVKKIPVKKEYLYNAASGVGHYGNIRTEKEFGTELNAKVGTYLTFKNNKPSNLGVPLPAGRIRVNTTDSELIGEDSIHHTAKDEEIRIAMGTAFDIVGERKQLSFTLDNNRKTMEETFEITLKNHKNQDVNVTVSETLYRGSTWEIQNSSTDYRQINAQAIFFPIFIKKEGETKFQYTVRYTW